MVHTWLPPEPSVLPLMRFLPRSHCLAHNGWFQGTLKMKIKIPFTFYKGWRSAPFELGQKLLLEYIAGSKWTFTAIFITIHPWQFHFIKTAVWYYFPCSGMFLKCTGRRYRNPGELVVGTESLLGGLRYYDPLYTKSEPKWTSLYPARQVEAEHWCPYSERERWTHCLEDSVRVGPHGGRMASRHSGRCMLGRWGNRDL